MRASVLAALAAAAMLATSAATGVAGGNAIRLAQADLNARRTPEPAPKLVIEEPRPPRVTIETEGRGGDHSCRSARAPERGAQAKVTEPERACDPE